MRLSDRGAIQLDLLELQASEILTLRYASCTLAFEFFTITLADVFAYVQFVSVLYSHACKFALSLNRSDLVVLELLLGPLLHLKGELQKYGEEREGSQAWKISGQASAGHLWGLSAFAAN